MNKIISTQFFVEKEVANKKHTVASSGIKQNILEIYKVLCEIETTAKFRVIRREVSEEVIAESEDVRQTLLPFE